MFFNENELIDKVLELIRAGEFDKALEVAEKIEDSYAKSWTLSSIAKACAEVGELGKALEVIDKALEVAEEIEDSYFKSWTLSSIAKACAEIGEFDKALEIAKEI
ncbi:MAG: tetratricopeptide repeat protein [Archaeoglobus sp.]|nr:tetratricopeptide repeat protein [Archaeoglobus sp.]